MLLPEAIQEWLPEGHLAHFISDAVDGLDLRAFHVRYEKEGPRNQPFHPVMMVKVLVYGYATGRREFVTVTRHKVERLAILARASHLHYILGMKTSTLPAVRVEPALRSDAEAVLDEGESLSDFVASCVRDGVAWRRTQDAFLAHARDAVERSEREDSGISHQEVLRQMDIRLEAARQRLAAGKPSAGR